MLDLYGRADERARTREVVDVALAEQHPAVRVVLAVGVYRAPQRHAMPGGGGGRGGPIIVIVIIIHSASARHGIKHTNNNNYRVRAAVSGVWLLFVFISNRMDWANLPPQQRRTAVETTGTT